MGLKSVSAHVVAKSAGVKPRPVGLVMADLETELRTLRRWLDADSDTPYKREAAARIRALCDELERSR